jgi:hypothetical protein
MMKHITVLVALALTCLTSSIALAAVPIVEPLLPPDIEQYDSQRRNCTLAATATRPEKMLVMDVYQREDDATSTIITIRMSGEKITQRQYGYDNLFQITYFIFVKNSPAHNWTKFGSSELREASAQLGAEFGLTAEELASCNGQ